MSSSASTSAGRTRRAAATFSLRWATEAVPGTAAQRAGALDDELDPAHLVFMMIALAAWWISVPQLAQMLTGADDRDADEHARRRAFVVRAAERLALPRP